MAGEIVKLSGIEAAGGPPTDRLPPGTKLPPALLPDQQTR
jgi:hypothetical protein